MWFGGFGFYASFVVPVGNEVLGSFEQAMVTRQVTFWLNVLGALAGFLMLLESFSKSSFTSNRVKRIQFVSALSMLFMQAILFGLHPQIDAFVELEVGEVKGDYDQFYLLHRLYLWTSTFQWVAGWIWLGCFAKSGLSGQIKTSL